MDYTFYEIFDIDASDIWQYERNYYFDNEQRDRKSIDWLYNFIQDFFLRAKHEPFLKIEDVDKGTVSSGYYERYVRELDSVKQGHVLTVFACRGNFYDMGRPCVVKRKELHSLDFEQLFALKLRQYFDGLSFLEEFLNHQTKTNFQEDIPVFARFLNMNLFQYDKLIDPKINKVVTSWIEEKKTISASLPDNPPMDPGLAIIKPEDPLPVPSAPAAENHETFMI